MRFEFGEFALDTDAFELRRSGEVVDVEPQVFDVLTHLVSNHGRLVTKEELLDSVWGDRFVSESALTSRIKSVRDVLGDDGQNQRLVKTVHGRGYRFVADVVEIDVAVPSRRDDPAATAGDGDGGSRRPTGTVTFLFSDVEGSTRLWDEHGERMQRALETHDGILRRAIEEHGGYVFSTQGDFFAAAFHSARAAVACARTVQSELAAQTWPDAVPIKVRIGLHAGEAQERDGNYFGGVVNRAARIGAAGHGGQVVLSSALASLVADEELVDLGEHRLRDLTGPERIWQLGVGDFSPLRTLDAVRTNLPVERTPLVGREAEIAQVAGLLAEHRLVTLLGIGGSGKTRLAAAAASEVARRFPDGTWFVDLVPATDEEQVAEAIATAAGLQLSGTDPVQALGEVLVTRDALFVLDNCEHLTDEVADVVDLLLERTAALRLLVTSREPMQLPDERQMLVPPLEVGNDLTAPAVQLFVAAAERSGADVSVDDVGSIAEICGRLDGLPLSIELAAAQLRQLSLDELKSRLITRFDLLARGRRRRGRQASLLGVLEDTWSMLDSDEADLLLQLAAFPSTFSVDDAEGASGRRLATARMLAALVDLGLVIRAPDYRHRLLETVKLFARERWAETSDPESFLERHTQWILDHLTSYPAEDWFVSIRLLSWANEHYDDHRAVEDRLARTGRTAELAALLETLALTYMWGGGTRASALIERTGEYLRTLDLAPRERGVLGLVAAGAGLPARRPDIIERRSRDAVDTLDPAGSPLEYAAALVIDSWMTVFQDFDAAIRTLADARRIADDARAPKIGDVALVYLIGFHEMYGQDERAAEATVEVYHRIGDRPTDYGLATLRLFEIASYSVRDPARARSISARLIEEFNDVGADFGIGFTAQTCQTVAIGATGDVDATRRSVAAVREMTKLTNNDDGLPDLLLPAAALAWGTGAPELARRWLTAVRFAGRPTSTFMLTIMFRKLRAEVGPLSDEPLPDADLDGVFDEALEWMESL